MILDGIIGLLAGFVDRIQGFLRRWKWRKMDREFVALMKRWPDPHSPEFSAVPAEVIRAFARRHRTDELVALRRYGFWSECGNIWL